MSKVTDFPGSKAKFQRRLGRVLGHCRWLRFGVRDRLLRLAHNPDKAITEPYQVPFFGYLYSGNFNVFIDWSAYYYGAYSRHEILVLSDILDCIPHATSLDVGANVGHHSLFLASRCRHVHSFEPFAPVRAQLEEKVTLNSLAHLTAHPFGLSDVNMKLPFTPPQGTNTGTGSFQEGGTASLELEVRRGDDVVSDLSIENVDLLKIDTEGFEAKVLAGLSTTIDRCKPVILFEWSANSRGHAAHDAPDLSGYDLYILSGPRNKLGLFSAGDYFLKPIAQLVDGEILAIPKGWKDRAKGKGPDRLLKQLQG